MNCLMKILMIVIADIVEYKTKIIMEKTTRDLLLECEFKIDRLEKQIEVKNSEILINNIQLEKLYEQRKNYLNYLNDED